jgi:Fuc2NAc and GlcNAc transferase
MHIILIVSSLLLGGTGAYAIKSFASQWGLVDCPNDRSSHNRPTPKGGGIGILAAFAVAAWTLNISYIFWLPAAFLSLLSLVGDRLDFSPKIRLPLQFCAALILVWFSDFGFTVSLFMIFASIIFIVGTANWYNFMDGINGIAALTAFVAFGFLAGFSLFVREDKELCILAICISFSCLGFLPFNFPKAKVFMGDVGSILLGFIFASLVVRLSQSVLDFVCLGAFLFPFYADELITMTIRVRKRENLLAAHRKHLYQLLVNEMRMEHWKVAASYAALQAIVSGLVLWARSSGIAPVTLLLLFFFCGFVLAHYVVRKKRFMERVSSI